MKTEAIRSLAIATMPPNIRTAFLKWEDGQDLRTLYPHATFFRHRKQIIEFTGIDISNVRDISNPYAVTFIFMPH